jgi:hypothetical protein
VFRHFEESAERPGLAVFQLLNAVEGGQGTLRFDPAQEWRARPARGQKNVKEGAYFWVEISSNRVLFWTI